MGHYFQPTVTSNLISHLSLWDGGDGWAGHRGADATREGFHLDSRV
jgi:hypothetical protein